MKRWLPLLLTGCILPYGFESDSQDSSSEGMVFLEEGDFVMGYPDLEPGPYGNHWKVNQQPEHWVSLSGFFMDETEVTVAAFTVFLDDLYKVSPTSAAVHFHPLQPISTELVPIGDSANEPIRYVNWYDAATYCAWAGKRLPTESEWERAAKGLGDSGRGFPWVEGGADCQKAVYFTNNVLCENGPAAVASRSPAGDTPEGLKDMAGNVSEWVSDWYGPYSETVEADHKGPDSGRYKILRGGGFRETSDALRTRDRVPADPSARSEGVGFRCAMDG